MYLKEAPEWEKHSSVLKMWKKFTAPVRARSVPCTMRALRSEKARSASSSARPARARRRFFLNDREVSAFDRRQLADYRRRDIGFVFQFYNLIPNLTALENVELASQIVRDSLPAPQVLTDVGLGERMRNFPAQLSGGEQQRVAIARALAKKPSLLLCDEPTGALDYATGKQILALLQDQSRKNGMTVVIITHNSALTAMADRVIGIRNGTVAYAHLNEHVTPVEEIEW